MAEDRLAAGRITIFQISMPVPTAALYKPADWTFQLETTFMHSPTDCSTGQLWRPVVAQIDQPASFR